MKKSSRIRLFLVSGVLVCCLSYGGGYYFSIYQSEKRMNRELALIDQESTTEDVDSVDSAVAVAAYEFVLCEEEGYIIVYYADKETVYSNTDIKVDNLSEELQEEILAGKPIYSESELYNFLESYSS